MNITDIKGSTKLLNGVEMPYLGLGVYQMEEGKEIEDAIHYALDAGYRHIDTAALYYNEEGVGKAIRSSNVNRSEIFVTTKVWNSDQGYDQTLRAFDKSMKLLGFDYIDLYLIHWPVRGKFNETWKALERIYSEKRARAIGVSNFLIHQLDELLTSAQIVPMVNQVEFHPFAVQQALIDYCSKKNIQFEAWGPLIQGRVVNDKTFEALAKKYNKSIAQIILRWNLQKGVVTIPKSSKKERIIENASIFDFSISEADMKTIDALDKNQRFGAHPDTFNF